tara:strand:- start:19531 stop:20847 length:1317 start_codon:yes stop_codon:yes gene_type:complete
MNIYVIVEIKTREFIPKFLLSLEAALNNHDIYLGNIDQLLDKNIFNPGLLYHKSLTPTKKRHSLLKKLKRKKFVIASLDEEHGGISPNAQSYVKTRYGEKTIKLADMIFTWGKFDYDNLSNTYKKYKKKFINSGNPRVDLWREDFQKYYGKRKKEYVLIASNYNFLFGYKTLLQQYSQKKEFGYFKRGMPERYYFNRVSKEGILLEHLIFSLKNLSRKFKSKKFLFRPHPEENIEAWEYIFDDCKNIQVKRHRSLSEALNKAEIVLHNGCTSGLESALRKIPTIAYMPAGDMSTGHPIANKVSNIAKTEKQLIKKLQNIFRNNKKNLFSQEAKKEIKYRYENLGKLPAYKKIVQSWNKYDNPTLNFENSSFAINKFFLTKRLKKKLSLRPFKNFKFDPFTNYEISEIKKKLTKINPKFEKVSVEIVGDDLLKIYLNNK